MHIFLFPEMFQWLIVVGLQMGFTGGVYRLTQDDNGNFDVIFTGKGGQFISAIQDGGSVAPFSYDKNQISILVLYMGSVVETFSFIKNNEGNNELILTQTKTRISPKAASYRAKCSPTRLIQNQYLVINEKTTPTHLLLRAITRLS